MLVEVALPPAVPRTGWAFLEVARRHGDYAQVGIAARVSIDDADRCREARLVYLSVGDGPVEAREAARMLAVGESALRAGGWGPPLSSSPAQARARIGFKPEPA